MTRVELACPAWEADALPLSYISKGWRVKELNLVSQRQRIYSPPDVPASNPPCRAILAPRSSSHVL